MKLQSNLLIATAAIGLFFASTVQANISKALQSVCISTEKTTLASDSTIPTSTDSERNNYRSKLAAHFTDTNCFGKRMIETNKDGLVYKTNLSEPSNNLAIAPY